MIAATLDFVTKLGWGAIAGEGDGIAAVAGDLAFSMVPVVGVYSDIRDMGKELLKLWPGGESPNWTAFGFAAAGIAGEFFKPGDLLLTLGKKLAVVTVATSPVWSWFLSSLKFAKEANFGKIQEASETLLRYIGDADFRKLVDGGLAANPNRLVDNVEDVDKLVKVVRGLDPDIAVATLKKVADDPIAARKLLDTLSQVDPADLARLKPDPRRLDIVVQNISSNDKPWKAAEVKKYLDSPRGVWGVGDGFRGEAIERFYGHNVPNNYTAIDAWDAATGTATSIKSADLTLISYNPSNVDTLFNTMMRNFKVEDFQKFPGYAGRTLDTFGKIRSRALKLVVPLEPTSAIQEEALRRLAEECTSRGISFQLIRSQF